MSDRTGTRPFAPFEWMLSLRYLRSRRREGFISVIAGFSFLGIMLGVATLIIVMAVMNGFRQELLDKILGLNGHLLVQPLEKPLTDWEEVADRISKVPGVRLAAPIVEGQALASSPFNSAGVLVRGIRSADLMKLTSIANNIKQGTFDGFDAGQVERNVMFLILTLIILVAALNIISGLIMLVKDKGGDIATLRTMGATQGSVMRIFLITGASIGVVGTIAGFVLGLVVCLNVESIRQFLSWLTRTELFSPELYFLSRLPAEMDASETTAVVVMALMLSLLATLYPSWRAARLDPVEALRYE